MGTAPVPLRPILCVTAGLAFRLLSVRVTVPVIGPPVVGLKSTARLQLAPAASVPAVDEVLIWGQVVERPTAKLSETLGFSPVAGTGKVSGAVPMFLSVT